MEKIKYQCLKKYNALIVFLISVLGFSSASSLLGGCMYGSPVSDYAVQGKIEADKTINPIAGIKVEMSIEKDSENGKVIVGTSSAVSGNDGTYVVFANGKNPIDQTCKIKFTDIDGSQNGEYETLDTTIVFQNPVFTGGSGQWDEGQTVKKLNVKLKPKK
jgi:putative lipoprotein (rSAM/lipoprotein system)